MENTKQALSHFQNVADSFQCRECYDAIETIRAALAEGQKPSHNSAITPPEERDCDTCANDGLCYVTRLKCRGYMRAAQ